MGGSTAKRVLTYTCAGALANNIADTRNIN